MEADDFVLRVQNRFRAAVDNVVAAQARIGIQLDATTRPSDIKVGDYMYLDGKHVPRQVPLKFASRWFGPFRVQFFEECHADLAVPDDGLVLPLISPAAGAHDPRYEVDKIL